MLNTLVATKCCSPSTISTSLLHHMHTAKMHYFHENTSARLPIATTVAAASASLCVTNECMPRRHENERWYFAPAFRKNVCSWSHNTMSDAYESELSRWAYTAHEHLGLLPGQGAASEPPTFFVAWGSAVVWSWSLFRVLQHTHPQSTHHLLPNPSVTTT